MAVLDTLECRNENCPNPTQLEDVMVSPAQSKGQPLRYREWGETEDREALCATCRSHLARILHTPRIGGSLRINDKQQQPSPAVVAEMERLPHIHPESVDPHKPHLHFAAVTRDGQRLVGQGTLTPSQPSCCDAQTNRAPDGGYLN